MKKDIIKIGKITSLLAVAFLVVLSLTKSVLAFTPVSDCPGGSFDSDSSSPYTHNSIPSSYEVYQVCIDRTGQEQLYTANETDSCYTVSGIGTNSASASANNQGCRNNTNHVKFYKRLKSTPTATATATSTPVSTPTATPTVTSTATPTATATGTPVATSTPVSSEEPTATPQATVTPTPLVCSEPSHLNAAGDKCVEFEFSSPPSPGGGSVQGLSTDGSKVLGLADTGSFSENLYLFITLLGASVTALGIKRLIN